MDRKKFINDLKSNLRGLDEDQVIEIVADYNEHFDVGKDKGRSEEEICKSLGDPVKLGKQLSKKQQVESVEEKVQVAEDVKSPRNLARAVFATAALGFFNIVFVLGPALGILGVLVGFCVAAISVLASGITMSVASFLAFFIPNANFGVHPSVVFFVGVGVAALGVLLCMAMYYVMKLTYIVTVKYLKFNIKLIKPKNE